jgi:Zn finger protein HypA/HybF involved in hydrogenase expression
MHELSLVEQLIAECVRRAGDRPVTAVRVRYASTIPEDGLRQAFAMLSRGGPLEAATLEAEPFAVNLRCACGFEGALGHHDLVSSSVAICPDCGDVSTRRREAELELVEVRRAGPAERRAQFN